MITGWCSSGSHAAVQEGKQIGCPGEYRTFFIDKRKVVYGDIKTCDCPCHTPETVVGSEDKSKTKRRRRKK